MAHTFSSAQPPTRHLTISKLFNFLEHGFSLPSPGKSDSHPTGLAGLLKGHRLKAVKVLYERKSPGYTCMIWLFKKEWGDDGSCTSVWRERSLY